MGFSRRPQRDAKPGLLQKRDRVWVPHSHSTFSLRVGNRAGGHQGQSTQVAPDLGDRGELGDEPHNRDLRTTSHKGPLEGCRASVSPSDIAEFMMCTDFG